MGEGSIDARGGATLLGQNVTWWDLAHEAKVKDQQQSVPAMIALRHVDNFTLYNITLRNSPGFHVSVNQTDGFTAWGVKIMTPKTARNTDGIDPGSSRNITIAYSYIHTGDDDVCLKPSGAGPVSNMSVLHDHFYTGHGMSIGSGTYGGVDHLLSTISLSTALTTAFASSPIPAAAASSIRSSIATSASATFPIPSSSRPTTPLSPATASPSTTTSRLRTCTSSRPAPTPFTDSTRITSSESSSTMSSPTIRRTRSSTIKDADITLGPNLGNLEPKGNDVAIAQAPDSAPGQPLDCDARFVPFPDDKTAPEMAGKIPPEDKTYYVAADGTGDYYSIQRALDMVPKTGGAVLSVSPGVYREVITVDKPNVTIRSTNPDAEQNRSSSTIAAPARTAALSTPLPSTSPPTISSLKTSPSRTTSTAPTRNCRRARRRWRCSSLATAPSSTMCASSAIRTRCFPAAAIARNNTAGCTLTRQYFSDCYIAGNVDFIFGDSKAVFENCEIHSTPHDGGFITAQSKHYPEEDSGFVFDHCKLTADPAVTGTVYLGRPWRPYATVIYHAHLDGRQDRPGRLERMACRTNALARHRLLCRIRFLRPRRASR